MVKLVQKKPESSIVFLKKDFISETNGIGFIVEELGLDENISDYLKELKINQFYKFQDRVPPRISMGLRVN